MRLGLRTKLLMLFCLFIVISLGHFMLIKITEQKAGERLAWVIHTHEVISESKTFLGHLRDAETGQRGYLLTLDPKYLEPYEIGISGSKYILNRLKGLTRDNSYQKKELEQISELMTAKFSELSETIRYADSGESDKSLQLVKSDIGKQLMDQIRSKIDSFIREERKLLIQRKAAFDDNQELFRTLFFVEAIMLIFFVGLISIYIQRKVIRPLESLTENAKRISDGSGTLDISVSSNDEVGQLVSAFKKMYQNIQANSVSLMRLSDELKVERDKALQASVTDSLTGLYNRRKFEEICKNELRRARRNVERFNLGIIDIDYFKKINDVYGHAHGDEVLQRVAECLRKISRRPNDFVFRLGGEEFVYITTAQDDRAAKTYAEIIRSEIESLQIPNKGSKVSDFLTVSVGVVTEEADSEVSSSDLLKRADERLYAAKSLGRNRTVATCEG